MLKWVGGCLVALIVVVGIVMIAGYRKLKEVAAKGPAATVIYAPAERVFASLADADSMTEWRLEGLGIRSSRTGPLRAGDSLRVQTTMGPNRQQRSLWIVTQSAPGRVFAVEMRDDGTGQVMASRRDSLIAHGADSTTVISTFAAALVDSLRAMRADTSGGGAADMAGMLFLSAMRVQSEAELARLKRRIEGDPEGSP